ncbi:endonuclease domain-containing protein [Nesterenkonia sp. CF4.4]|uniref:endonuclease domain-containing protein n=1 Tax=Nesterenkonia sp. CF4.4 TaxID=3373079 RepID=UPI003EE5B4CB
MRRPGELPSQLAGPSFGQVDLANAGVSRDRVRRRDVVTLSRGIYAQERVLLEPGEARVLHQALTLARTLPDVWISHVTAAQIHRLPLPERLLRDTRVHLSHAAGTTRRIRRPEVSSHRVHVLPEQLVRWKGAWLSSRVRTWWELTTLLTEEELVIVGDHLLRRPYRSFEARTTPFAVVTELQEIVEQMGRAPGLQPALAALALMRVGSDSATETRLRLALVRAGLPEPTLQVPARPNWRHSPCADMGYPDWKIALEYDGGTHFTPEQARSDQRRDNVFISAGWTVLHFNAVDDAEGFASAVAQVRELLARRRAS